MIGLPAHHLSYMKQESLFAALPLFSKFGIVLFWVAVFIINAGPHWEVYVSNRELIETIGTLTSLQVMVALFGIKIFVPRFLDQGKTRQFSLALIASLIAASYIYILIRYLYLEPTYPLSYKGFLSMFGEMTLLERLNPAWTLRYIIFSKMPLFFLPTVLLMSYDFYQKQQSLLLIREQKRTAELDALKNQLNPHFLFNTLNNIYALSLKKSDQTPIAIERLSGILDYVVYQCNDKYVSLNAEIKLIEDYIALEKIRYGKRLDISFSNKVTRAEKIAPLLLLTLLENACKHSTREELNRAQVSIVLETIKDGINIQVSNSKPSTSPHDSKQDKVGLKNLRKQLVLLYPNAHRFEITDTADKYVAKLFLNTV